MPVTTQRLWTLGAIGIAIAVALVVFGYAVLTEDGDDSDGQVAQPPTRTATPSPTATASPIPSPTPATATPEATAEATVEPTEELPPTPVITQEPEPRPVDEQPSPVQEEPPPLPSEEPSPPVDEEPSAEDSVLIDIQCSDARLDVELYRILISGASVAGLPTDYLEQHLAEVEQIANSPQCEGRGLVPVYREHLASLCATAGEFYVAFQQSLLFLDPAGFSAMQSELAKLDAFEQGYCVGY